MCGSEWKAYAWQEQRNAKPLTEHLLQVVHQLVSGGTDSHLLLWNVRTHGLTGSKVEKLLDAVSISVNKSTIPGDKSAVILGGIRVSTPALTSRGMAEKEMLQVATFLDRVVALSVEIQAEVDSTKLTDFTDALVCNAKVKGLRDEVEAMAVRYPMPSFDGKRHQVQGRHPSPLTHSEG